MQNQFYVPVTPVSFPIRMSHKLHEEFSRISNETRINKSVLARTAIERLIKDIDSSGAKQVVNSFCEV